MFRFSDDHGMPLFETSAKDDSKADHVEAIFLTLAHKVRNNKTLFKPGKFLSNRFFTCKSNKIMEKGQQFRNLYVFCYEKLPNSTNKTESMP